MKLLPAAFIALLAIIGITALQQLREKPAPAIAEAAPRPLPERWCPKQVDARVLTRSVYREADAEEAVLACFYALPAEQVGPK